MAARIGFVLALTLLLLDASKAPARAIPLFAHQYGVTCAKCHSVIPHLNEFGAAFLAYGERLPVVSSGHAFPLAFKTNLVASSQNQGSGPTGAGLPKAVVDEVEAFTTGTLGARANYFAEQYVVDGGQNGLLHDVWIGDRVNPWAARIPVQAQIGMFTLPVPVDPETFRDSYQDYTPFTMTAGSDPFFFKDPKMGMRAGIGDPLRGLRLDLFAGPGYDRQSGLPKTGVDTETYVQDGMGAFTVSLFRYDGLRPVAGGPNDRFQRTGYGLTYGQWTRFSSETVLLNGWDSNCATPGYAGCSSSGGFEQLRYAFNRRLYALTRYEGTNSPTGGFTRDGVVLLGYGPSENSRVTVEDVIARAPQTHTINLQFSIGY
ncbi:MAG TPA: hypothetical protein VGZ02_14720 [Candidatus Baltobacteraceae bacterium]|nr:hypothetical protein [Candidatus Baltobacteraceae bacterium]